MWLSGRDSESSYLMRMPELLFFRIQRLKHILWDHVLYPNEAGILGGRIVD